MIEGITSIITIGLMVFAIGFYIHGKVSQQLSDKKKAYEESTIYYRSLLAHEGRRAAIMAQAAIDRSTSNSVSLLRQAHDKSYQAGKTKASN